MKTIVNYAQKVKEQHALNKTLAPVETDLTSASKAYAVGQKFIHDGVLYQAKTAIAQGAALVLNTNYEAADDVSSEIQTLTNEVDTIVNELSAKNFLNISLSELKALNINGTWVDNVYSANGLTFTVNADKTITISGTATANTNLSLKNDISISGDYILSGCPVGGSQVDSEGYNIQARVDGSWIAAKDSGNGLPITANSIIDRTLIHVANGTVMNNHVFKSMIRPASIKNSDYVPYAMTNRELTDKVAVKNVTITPASGVTFDYTGTYKIGNLVILNFRFILDADFTVATDAPIATIDAAPLDSSILAPAAMAWNGEVGGLLGIMNNGVIKLSTSAHFAASKSYVVNTTYVCK